VPAQSPSARQTAAIVESRSLISFGFAMMVSASTL
jgi:hypothetical protein